MELVHPTHVLPGAVVFDAAVYASIQAHISDVRRDHQHTVVRRTLRNCRMLEKLGYEAPSPMLETYNWPGRFTPFEHQRTTAAFLTINDRAFVFNEMGTGKTMAAIWAWHYLRTKGLAGKLLIICPLSCTESVWARELFMTLPSIGVAVLTGDKDRRLEKLATDAKALIINHDGIKVIEKELGANGNGISHIIVDEASAFKNHRSALWKSLRYISRNRSVWMMTGTPCSQGPLDAWALAQIICPQRVDSSFTKFRDKMCIPYKQGTGHGLITKYKPRVDALDQVFAQLQPAVRFTKAACGDMPPVVSIDREIPLTRDQKKMAVELATQWITEDEQTGQIVTAANAAVRVTKLLQVYQGSVLSTTGQPIHLDCGHRLQALLDIIDASTAKVIVFASYRAVIDRLVEAVGAHYPVEKIDGSVTGSARADIIRRFQSNNGPRVLIAHPKSAGHGITLTAASTTVWWGPYFSTEIYKQAINRMDRPGQLNDMTVIHLTCGGGETRAYDVVRKNLMQQATLLNLYDELTQRRGNQ